jgi:hypothetical protein
MMKPSVYDKILRRIYGCFDDETDELLYLGSSYCPLNILADNHIRAFERYPEKIVNGKKINGHTYFRCALRSEAVNSHFKTIVEIKCDLETIETIEGQMIRALLPKYNEDLYPERSSKWYNRYDK